MKKILLITLLSIFKINSGPVNSTNKDKQYVVPTDKIVRLIRVSSADISGLFEKNNFKETLGKYKKYKNKKTKHSGKLQEIKFEVLKLYVPLIEKIFSFKLLFTENTGFHAASILTEYLFASAHNSSILEKIITEQKLKTLLK